MYLRFWGVRGSLPTPITPQQIQSKIMAAIQRITPEDIKDEDSKIKFISSLPSWIFGTTGGNTPCVEIKTDKYEYIFDAGTGIRVLGKSNNLPKDKHYNLFISHFHWDHIQGLPFFDAAYDPESSFDIYSGHDGLEDYLRNQMKTPYYPVTFDAFTKKINFHKLETGKEYQIGDAKIICCQMSHPGISYSYALIDSNGYKTVYATDVELKSKDFNSNPDCAAVFKDADCIILDSQYTVEEVYRKENWGHSAFCYAVDFAVHWNIKKIYMFHHEPTYDDKKLNHILQAARWYAQYIEHSDIEILISKEDEEVYL